MTMHGKENDWVSADPSIFRRAAETYSQELELQMDSGQ
jgi:hypothetical protein